MFLFVSHQQTRPCELQLARWEYMKILTSCPVVCSLPHHSRSLYRAGWPARRKSEWTAQSSAREKKKNRGIILFVLLRKKWASKMTMMTNYGLHDLVQNIMLWSFWQMLGLWYDLILVGIWFFCITISVFATTCVHLTCGGQDLLCRESLQQYSTSLWCCFISHFIFNVENCSSR